jgi:molybdopterin molybdotransferase
MVAPMSAPASATASRQPALAADGSPGVPRVADHLTRVLDTVAQLGDIELQLLDAHRCVVAEDVVAPWSLPPFDTAAVDGYAVCSADLSRVDSDEDDGEDAPAAADDAAERSVDPEENPLLLPVVGESRPGVADDLALGSRHTMRVRKGDRLPGGADAVVPLSLTDGGDVMVQLRSTVEPGTNVRAAAADVGDGDIVMRAGTYLGSTQVGLLAAVGRERIKVRPKPRVVVVSVGSALVEPGLPVAVGQVTDSNSYTLAAAVDEAGALAYRVPALPEDPHVVAAALSDQLVRADLVITAGGIGNRDDVMRAVLETLGEVRFSRVPMCPGPWQGVGVLGEERVPVLALPGDPVSAFVSFEVFARPAIRRMLGVGRLHRPSIDARLEVGVSSRRGERMFLLARLTRTSGEDYVVRPLEDQQEHHVTNLAGANALAVVGESDGDVPAGTIVSCLMLERRKG